MMTAIVVNTRLKKTPKSKAPASAPVEFLVKSRLEFRKGYDVSFKHGAIFCPTRKMIPEGTRAIITVRVGRRQPTVVLHGRVVWRQSAKNTEKIRAGVCVEFDPSEAARRDYILEEIDAEDPRSRRRHQRTAVEVPVVWRIQGENFPLPGTLSDVGPGGAFIRTRHLAPQDADVVLDVSPPGAQVAMSFVGRVTWVVPSGLNRGFGVKWRARDAGGERRVRELVRRLANETSGTA